VQEAANTEITAFGTECRLCRRQQTQEQQRLEQSADYAGGTKQGITALVQSADYAGGRKHRKVCFWYTAPSNQEAANTGKYVFGTQRRICRRQLTQESAFLVHSADCAGGSRHRKSAFWYRVPIMQEAANTGIHHFVHSAE